MSVDIDPLTAAWLAGAVFRRYNTSRFKYDTTRLTRIAQNRSATTFLRFSIFFLCYLLTLLAIYWLFGSFLQTSPDIFSRLWPAFSGPNSVVSPGLSGTDLAHLTGPVVAALMLTVLLPTLPLLKSFDDWLVQKFWDLGRIPGNVLHQSKKLHHASLTFSPRRRSEIIARAELFHIPSDHQVFKESDSVEHHWVRLCHLMLELDAWRMAHAGRYARYLEDKKHEFGALGLEFDNLSRQVSSYGRWKGNVPDESGNESSEILEDFRKRLAEEVQSHYKAVCTFVACAVFASELSETARRRSLQDMGFDQDAALVESLTPTQVIKLSLAIAAAFFGISLVEAYLKHPDGVRLAPILFLSLIMTTSYGAAAIAGIIPKATWSFADIEQGGRQSILAYLLATLLAVLFGLIAMISIRYTFSAVEGLNPVQNIDKVIKDLSWSHPYLVQSAAIGFVTAFCIDSFQPHFRVGRRWHRWADAAGLGLVMAAASVVTYCWMEGVVPFEATRDPAFRGKTDPVLFVAKGAVVGLVIGSLVPSWYRENRLRTPMQWLTQLLNRQGREVARQAGKLDHPGQLLEALSAVAAYVASADDKVLPIEQNKLSEFLSKLRTGEGMEISVDDAMKRFGDLA